MTDTEIKRWRFVVSDWDDQDVYVDGEGGPDGDEKEAEFVGTSHQAMQEGDRRCDLWESRTGRMAARVTRESYGPPNSGINRSREAASG